MRHFYILTRCSKRGVRSIVCWPEGGPEVYVTKREAEKEASRLGAAAGDFVRVEKVEPEEYIANIGFRGNQ